MIWPIYKMRVSTSQVYESVNEFDEYSLVLIVTYLRYAILCYFLL